MKIETEVSIEDINNLVVSALEGGSNYWYMIEEKIEPSEWVYDSFAKEGTHYIGDYALNKDGGLVFSVKDDNTVEHSTLNLENIKTGLEIMARDYKKAFADILAENTDSETGDIFLQCCLFGEIIYG